MSLLLDQELERSRELIRGRVQLSLLSPSEFHQIMKTARGALPSTYSFSASPADMALSLATAKITVITRGEVSPYNHPAPRHASVALVSDVLSGTGSTALTGPGVLGLIMGVISGVALTRGKLCPSQQELSCRKSRKDLSGWSRAVLSLPRSGAAAARGG